MSDAWSKGANIGEMITGLAAVWSAGIWTRDHAAAWLQQRQERRLRWWASLGTGAIAAWHVRLVEDPKLGSSRVVLEVLDSAGGRGSENLASTLRAHVRADHQLARVPTTGELELIHEWHKRFDPSERPWWARLCRVPKRHG